MSDIPDAMNIVMDRMQPYGHPKENFERGITMLRAYIKAKYGADLPLVVDDYPQIMILFKQARLMNGYQEDSVTDQEGYAKTHHMLHMNLAKDMQWDNGAKSDTDEIIIPLSTEAQATPLNAPEGHN